MNATRSWLMTAMTAIGAWGLTIAPALGQQPAPGSGPAAVEPLGSAARETLTAAEEIAIVRALAPLQLSRSQLAQLLPALESVQVTLVEFDQKEQARLAGHGAALEQARRDLLSGKGTAVRAQEQFDVARATGAQRRAGLRAELVASLRRALTTILTQPQVAQMAQGGQAVMMNQRMAGWRGGTGGRGGGGPGSQDRGGSGNPSFDRLDRIRAMSPAEFQQFVQEGPGRGGPGRGGPGQGGRGPGGQRDPQEQARFTAFLNQVRSLPHSQYLLQREQLAAQFMGGRGPGGTDDPEAATNAFVDRYLLSPSAPVAIRGLLQGQ